MGDGVTIIPNDVKHYLEFVIPELEKELVLGNSNDDLLELYDLYEEVLRVSAPYDFISYNKYLELDEDHNDKTKAFYHHRKEHLADIFEAFNDMEIHDKYDLLLIMTPPRVGKSTIELRFLTWIIGKYPEETQLLTSYSDNITTSFYIGTNEILSNPRYHKVFPDSLLVNQNAKREEIWLKTMKRYPSVSFVPIGGSMTGRSEATKYLFCDDLVSGIEEALSIVRLDNLWSKYSVNAKQRKKDFCKEVHIATPWSVHDPISKIAVENEDNPRCKIIKKPAFDENGESNFNFVGGFSTKYYLEMQRGMDEASFSALFMQEPIEREGILYNKDELMYYMDLPSGKPDAIVSVVDSKNLGVDYVSSPIGYVYGETVYIEDVVYNNGLPSITCEVVSNALVTHNVTRTDVELNNGGNYYAEKVDKLVKEKGGKTSIRMFFSANNKQVKIITYSDYVKKHFVFKDPSKYHPKSDYAKFMRDLNKWTQSGKNAHDDAPDSLAMLAQLIQELQGTAIKILNRRELGL